MKKRTRLLGVLLTALGVVALASPASAAPKKKPKNPPAQAPASQPTAEPEIEITPDAVPDANPNANAVPPPVDISPTAAPASEPAEPVAGSDKEITLGETEENWQDIVVVVRKPFLKQSRLELIPTIGVTLNDNMIRHYEFDAQLSYWLTDVLAIGVEGQYFRHQFLEPYDLIGREYRRLPTLNQYNFAGALNFHYVPIYAKFTMFNKYIVHWETMLTAGVGAIQTQVLPRDPQFQGWTNIDISPNVGVTARVFLAQWLTLDLSVRDYIFVDKFESVNRTTADVNAAMAEASSQLINNIVIGVGLSFWLPPTFSYTTFR
jgi:outer membrane beta-barrel protein